MRFLLLLAIFCVSVALVQPSGDEADFSAIGLRVRAAELRPDIEAVLGEPLPWPVDIRASRAADLETLLAEETVFLMSHVEDGMRGRPLEEFAKAQAKMISRALFGKVELKTGVLHIVPDNFRWMSRLTKSFDGLRRQGVADVVLIHELVHVYQHHRRGLDRFFGKPKSIGELQARNAVTEGHAQYVTRRVAARCGLTESFDLMLLAMRGPDVEVDSMKMRILKALANLTAFAYVEGERFLDTVCREFGYEEGLRRALDDPPTSPLMVSRPADHLPWMADRTAFDLAARRIERFLDETAPDVVRETFPREGLRAGFTSGPSPRRHSGSRRSGRTGSRRRGYSSYDGGRSAPRP